MPRRPRLDLPDCLYHVIARGVERRPIFLDERDHMSFVQRLASLVEPQDITLFAYALMNNHFHLVLRRGRLRLATFMARLLTGHAVVFNLRHHRSGHLFQNRYRSILCDADAYLLALVRYVHLNPVRAKMVERPLEYRWSSHSAYLARKPPSWLETDSVLRLLGGRGAFERFIEDGIPHGNTPELEGYMPIYCPDERRLLWMGGQVLGDEGHATAMTRLAQRSPIQLDPPVAGRGTNSLEDVVRRVTQRLGVCREAILAGSRIASVSEARRQIIWEAVKREGIRPVDLSRGLGVTRAAISQSLRRYSERDRRRQVC